MRFIDNFFSGGTRAATSAEDFLEYAYAVIFLHRQQNYSLLPYSRHYSHSTNCFLDFLREGDHGSVLVHDRYRDEMLSVLRKYIAPARAENTLLLLPLHHHHRLSVAFARDNDLDAAHAYACAVLPRCRHVRLLHPQGSHGRAQDSVIRRGGRAPDGA